MNPFSGEIPNTRKSVFQAIEKFNGASDADFANLRPLLEGIHATGRQMGDNFYAKILRLVGAKGRAYDLVELARSCKKTGLRLDSSEKVNELLHFIQMGAQESGWGRSETEQALRRAEVVVELLENEAHAPLTQIAGDLPLNRDPQVLLAPLHLAAALVVKHGVKDEKTVAKVNKLASTVVKLWPVGKGLKQLHPLQCYVEDNAMGYLLDSNKFVALVSPLLHSLDLASQAVTEPALAAELKSRRDTLEAEVKGHVARAVEKGQNGRGEIVYQKFFGAASA